MRFGRIGRAGRPSPPEGFRSPGAIQRILAETARSALDRFRIPRLSGGLVDNLRQGSTGDQVKLLQRLLNKGIAPTPPLNEDGIYGAKTLAALLEFKRSERMTPTPNVDGPVWQKLGITIDIAPTVTLFPQPTGMTCWSASATMVLGSNQSIGPGRAVLGNDGGMNPTVQNIETFTKGLHWRLYYPMSWTVRGIADLLRRGPAWAVGGGNSPTGGWLHAIVISGIWSDGDENGSGTMLRIHDPWPPQVGKVYGRFYRGTIDGFDFITLYVAQP